MTDQVDAAAALQRQQSRVAFLNADATRAQGEVGRAEHELQQLAMWCASTAGLAEQLRLIAEQAGEEGEGDEERGEGSTAAAAAAAKARANAAAATRAAARVVASLRVNNVAVPQIPPRTPEVARRYFAGDIRKQLYTDRDGQQLFEVLLRESRLAKAALEAGEAALVHLDAALVAVACDDPGSRIGAALTGPLLGSRLERAAADRASAIAAATAAAVLAAEEEERRAAAEAVERKARARAARAERAAVERAKAREALKAAAAAKAAEEAVLAEARERELELEREGRRKAAEEARKAEDAAMEERRRQLLSGDDPFWRARAAQAARDASFLLPADDGKEGEKMALPNPARATKRPPPARSRRRERRREGQAKGKKRGSGAR